MSDGPPPVPYATPEPRTRPRWRRLVLRALVWHAAASYAGAAAMVARSAYAGNPLYRGDDPGPFYAVIAVAPLWSPFAFAAMALDGLRPLGDSMAILSGYVGAIVLLVVAARVGRPKTPRIEQD